MNRAEKRARRGHITALAKLAASQDAHHALLDRWWRRGVKPAPDPPPQYWVPTNNYYGYGGGGTTGSTYWNYPTITPLTGTTNNTITYTWQLNVNETRTAATIHQMADDVYNHIRERPWLATSGAYVHETGEVSPEVRRRALRYQARRDKAVKRGRKLLLSLLTDGQVLEYARTQSFTVQGDSGRVYKLRKGRTVHELAPDGVAVASLCIHLEYGYNDEDNLITLLFMVQHEEEVFRRVANITVLTAGRERGVYPDDRWVIHGIPIKRAMEDVSEGGVILPIAA